MIAQVFTAVGPVGPLKDEMRQFALKAMGQGRELPGVEATIRLMDPSTGEALIINLFRDQAAMDATQAYSNEKIAESEDRQGGRVSSPHVYTEVIALL